MRQADSECRAGDAGPPPRPPRCSSGVRPGLHVPRLDDRAVPARSGSHAIHSAHDRPRYSSQGRQPSRPTRHHARLLVVRPSCPADRSVRGNPPPWTHRPPDGYHQRSRQVMIAFLRRLLVLLPLASVWLTLSAIPGLLGNVDTALQIVVAPVELTARLPESVALVLLILFITSGLILWTRAAQLRTYFPNAVGQHVVGLAVMLLFGAGAVGYGLAVTDDSPGQPGAARAGAAAGSVGPVRIGHAGAHKGSSQRHATGDSRGRRTSKQRARSAKRTARLPRVGRDQGGAVAALPATGSSASVQRRVPASEPPPRRRASTSSSEPARQRRPLTPNDAAAHQQATTAVPVPPPAPGSPVVASGSGSVAVGGSGSTIVTGDRNVVGDNNTAVTGDNNTVERR